MAKISQSQIRAAVRDIQKRDRLSVAQMQVSHAAKLRNLRRDLSRHVQPLFTDAGFNMTKINRLLTRHQREVHVLLKKQKSEATKQFSGLSLPAPTMLGLAGLARRDAIGGSAISAAAPSK